MITYIYLYCLPSEACYFVSKFLGKSGSSDDWKSIVQLIISVIIKLLKSFAPIWWLLKNGSATKIFKEKCVTNIRKKKWMNEWIIKIKFKMRPWQSFEFIISNLVYNIKSDVPSIPPSFFRVKTIFLQEIPGMSGELKLRWLKKGTVSSPKWYSWLEYSRCHQERTMVKANALKE